MSMRMGAGEPLSGIVQLYPEIRGPEDSFQFAPETGPALP